MQLALVVILLPEHLAKNPFRKQGMARALGKVWFKGRHSDTKNLSAKELEKFAGFAGKRLGKLLTHSKGGLGRRARLQMKQEFEAMRKAGEICNRQTSRYWNG